MDMGKEKGREKRMGKGAKEKMEKREKKGRKLLWRIRARAWCNGLLAKWGIWGKGMLADKAKELNASARNGRIYT